MHNNSQKPNIVLLITDQQRAEFTKRENYPLDTMPFTDALAKQGCWFNKAYTAAPICVAARVSLLTGRYPNCTDVRENRAAPHANYTMDLFDVMRSQNYKTAMIGKNHTHVQADTVDYFDSNYFHNGQTTTPETEEFKAFDEFLKTLNGCVASEATAFPLECQLPHRIISKTINWLDDVIAQEQPFLTYIALPEPHNPYQVPEPYFSMFPESALPPLGASVEDLQHKGFKWKVSRDLGTYTHPDYDAQMSRSRASYLGMMRLIDDQIERLVNYLKEKDVFDNTIFLVLSDHGDFIGDFGMVRKGPDMPEILMRIPLQISGPAILADELPSDAFVSIADLLPTICDAIHAPIPQGVQGKSLWPILTGASYPKEDFNCAYAEHGYGGMLYDENDILEFEHCINKTAKGQTFDSLNTYTQCGTMKMLRKENWILTVDCSGAGFLYDLDKDLYELNNLFDEPAYAEVKNRLVMDLLTEVLRHTDPLPLPTSPYQVKLHPKNYWHDASFVRNPDNKEDTSTNTEW